jgi:hypothetical protein
MKTYETIIKDINNGEYLGKNTVKAKDTDIVTTKVRSSKEYDNQIQFAKNKKMLDAEMKEFIENNEGAFVHLIFKYGQPIFEKLEEKVPGNKANLHEIRFIILATYKPYKGCLSYSNGQEIKKEDLGKIWDVKDRKGINDTYNILKECGYIYETEEGYLMINEDMVIKGIMKDYYNELKGQDGSYTYTRLFIDNVRNMYNGTASKQRKQLANLFKILPYINFKYNVFCSNPTETDETKLELLTWKDLARICGYDKTQVARFKKDLWNLKIYDHCAIGEFHCEAGMAICVNPKVYYGGDDVNDVGNLYAMFKMCEKK